MFNDFPVIALKWRSRRSERAGRNPAEEDVPVKDHMHRLMSEIGPLLEFAAVIESDDSDGWNRQEAVICATSK